MIMNIIPQSEAPFELCRFSTGPVENIDFVHPVYPGEDASQHVDVVGPDAFPAIRNSLLV
jgi:hypothetical protein